MSVALLLTCGLLASLVAWRWSVRGLDDANRVALVAVLGVTAAAFNVVVPVSSVEATTTVVLCTAIALGPRLAVAVAVVAILGSSIAGGLGVWSIYQLVAWSLTAFAGGLLAPLVGRVDWYSARGAAVLGLAAAACTVVFDLVLTVPTAMLTGQDPAAALLLGAAFTATHVVFSTAFTVVGGPSLLHALGRARLRLSA